MASLPRQVIGGLVLRETETKESDKILTVLTAPLGKIAVIARGARRKNSRLAAGAQFLAYSEMTLYQNKNWYMLDEAETIELFSGLRRDLEKLSLGAYLAELTESVCHEGSEAEEIMRLLLNALYVLSKLNKPQLQVKTAFEWRLMSQLGFAPLVECCAYCGVEQPREPMLDVVQGLLHCRTCRPKGQTGLSMPLCAGSLAALRHILYRPAEKLYSFTLEEEALRRLAQASEAFCAAQLEQSFRTLDFYKSIKVED